MNSRKSKPMRMIYTMTADMKALGLASTVVAEVHNVEIPDQHPTVDVARNNSLTQVLAMTDEYLNDQPVLESYRELVRKIQRSPKKFPPAAESLIRLIRRNERFPQINPAVDAYNTVVTRTFLALGVHDLDKLGGGIIFRLSSGQEPFTAVGTDAVKYTQPGDYVYADDQRVLAWLDSKDSELVKLSHATKNLVIVIQGTPFTTRDYNWHAAEDACQLIVQTCGGTYEIQPVD